MTLMIMNRMDINPDVIAYIALVAPCKMFNKYSDRVQGSNDLLEETEFSFKNC